MLRLCAESSISTSANLFGPSIFAYDYCSSPAFLRLRKESDEHTCTFRLQHIFTPVKSDPPQLRRNFDAHCVRDAPWPAEANQVVHPSPPLLRRIPDCPKPWIDETCQSTRGEPLTKVTKDRVEDYCDRVARRSDTCNGSSSSQFRPGRMRDGYLVAEAATHDDA